MSWSCLTKACKLVALTFSFKSHMQSTRYWQSTSVGDERFCDRPQKERSWGLGAGLDRKHTKIGKLCFPLVEFPCCPGGRRANRNYSDTFSKRKVITNE